MDERRRKFLALVQLAERLPKHPALMMLLGFLAGRLDRLCLLPPSEMPAAGGVRIVLTTPQARIWTGRWFQGWVGATAVPDPVVLISAVADRDVDIYLSVDFGSQVPAWYLEAVGTPAQPEPPLEERLEDLRRRVDSALDIYNECRRQLEAGDESRQEELRFLLALAQEEVERLGAELRRLTEELPASP
ncbi:MAG: hypothetical protein DIU84_00265 [Bacillota bacterium]|nr:MAG: hypothetical protein DIU84_00265 [Bacillota bacterium]